MNDNPPTQGSLGQLSRSLLNRERGADRTLCQEHISIRSPLRYPGGKSRAVKKIVEYFPDNLDTLASPFFGGGSVELACAAKGVQVYGYDGFEPLVNFWQATIEDAYELAQLVLRQYHPLTRTKFYALQKRFYTLSDRAEQAAAFFALNRSSFSGTTLSGGMSPGHPRFNESAIERLGNIKLRNLRVEHADFKDSLARHENDFLYLDPPYANSGNLYGNNGNMHDGFDHQGLADILTCRDGWVLSYNECEMVRDLYPDSHFITPEWVYGMSNNKASNEVLIFSKDFEDVA